MTPSPRPPRRVLMTVDAVGGVWRYACDLARTLAVHQIEVLLLGFGPAPSAAQLEEAGALSNVETRWTDMPLDWMAKCESELAGVPQEVLRIADQSHIDVLHLNLPTQVATRERRLPVVAVSHSCLSTWWDAVRPAEAFPADWLWHRNLTRSGLEHADVVIAPSAAHASALRRVYEFPREVRVVHNASDAPPADAFKDEVILSIGRWWDPGKNLSTLDDAAADCPWPVRAIGATRGPDGSSYEPRHVEVLGQLDQARTQAALASAGVFVSTALYEPFGLAVLEAARAGCPLVLSDIPTFRELWDGSAVFHEPGDWRALQRDLNRLISSPKERRELGEAARSRSAAYALEVQARELLGLYAEAMARHSSLVGA